MIPITFKTVVKNFNLSVIVHCIHKCHSVTSIIKPTLSFDTGYFLLRISGLIFEIGNTSSVIQKLRSLSQLKSIF